MMKMTIRLVKTGVCAITGAIGHTEFHHVIGRGATGKGWKIRKINDAIKKILGCNLVDYEPFIVELSNLAHTLHTTCEYRESLLWYIFDTYGIEEIIKLREVCTILGTHSKEKLIAFAILAQNGIYMPSKMKRSVVDSIPVGEVSRAVRHMLTKMSVRKLAEDLQTPMGTVKHWRKDVANPLPSNREKVMDYYQEWKTK